MGAVIRAIQATHHLHPVREPEDVSSVRRQLGRCATAHGVTAARVARAELAVTEIATNIVGHARGDGYVLFRGVGEGAGAGVEMIGVDRGPGIDDLTDALADHSTGDFERMLQSDKRPQGIGAGLSAVRRLASEFDVCSRRGAGTVVLARIGPVDAPAREVCHVGGVSVALDGFGVTSGDGWAIATSESECTAVVVDGLGHGPAAKVAADAALRAFIADYAGDVLRYVSRAHDAMRETRGGVLGICRVDREAGRAEFVGIGNVEGRVLLDGAVHGLTSRNGTLGIDMAAPATRLVEYPWGGGAVAIIHSDGVSARFDVEAVRPLLPHHPSTIAALIHRDFTRGRDDATVVVLKHRGGTAA